MPNHVAVDPAGIIHESLAGDQDGATISRLIAQTNALVRGVQAEHPGAPIRFMVDLSNIGRQKMSARRAGVTGLHTIPYEKIAITGASRFVKHTTALVIMASGAGAKVRLFNDKPSAMRWLAERS